MAIEKIIGQYGFPIAAFFLMYWMAHKQIKENTDVLRDLREVVKELKKDIKRKR